MPNHFLQGTIGFSSLGYHIRWPPPGSNMWAPRGGQQLLCPHGFEELQALLPAPIARAAVQHAVVTQQVRPWHRRVRRACQVGLGRGVYGAGGNETPRTGRIWVGEMGRFHQRSVNSSRIGVYQHCPQRLVLDTLHPEFLAGSSAKSSQLISTASPQKREVKSYI